MTRMSISQAAAMARQYSKSGRLLDAIAICRSILAADPQQFEAYRILGTIACIGGAPEMAEGYLQQAIALNPQSAECHDNLGVVFQAQGRLDAAEAAVRQALAIQPGYADAENDLANILLGTGRTQEAEAAYRRAIAADPRHPDAHSNLAMLLLERGDCDEAEAEARLSLEARPGFSQPDNTLGNIYCSRGKFDEAEAAYRRAVTAQEGFAEAESNLATMLQAQGRHAEAKVHYLRAMEQKPLAPGLHSNYLSCLQHTPGVTPAELAAAHAEWNRRHAEPLRGSWQPHPNTPDPERPVRIGFVSADLGSHPVGYFTVRLFEHLDPRQCLTFCYSFRSKEDDLSRRIAQSAGAWRNVYSLSIEQLAAQIRADGIDILFDLAGHTSNRLTLFARKPAPIQISWAGYVGTTGIKAMDYVLADRHHVPPEMEPYYQEKVLRMPDGYVCYDPPAYAPEVGPLPAAANGYVTFGSFNRLAKTTPEVVDVFCRVLKRVPDARMIVKFTGLDGPSTNRRYAEMFAQRGIDPQRLELLGNSPHAELLAQYNRIDVALDTFPYSGGLVTCEALWMGVPVITCPGQTFAGRHSLSHLTNAGLPELVAQDLDDYVQRAVALAGDRPRLAALRAALRSQVAASPLCDGRRFAANFARLMREVWCAWCANRR